MFGLPYVVVRVSREDLDFHLVMWIEMTHKKLKKESHFSKEKKTLASRWWPCVDELGEMHCGIACPLYCVTNQGRKQLSMSKTATMEAELDHFQKLDIPGCTSGIMLTLMQKCSSILNL